MGLGIFRQSTTHIYYLSLHFKSFYFIYFYSVSYLIKSKNKSKKYYDDKNRQTRHKYDIGDLVYVLKEPKTGKLDRNYTGPYTITEILDHHNAIIQDEYGNRKLKHLDKLKLHY